MNAIELAVDWLWEVKWWVDGADWRSWAVHAVIGLVATVVFFACRWLLDIVLSPMEAQAGSAMLVAWGLREGEQLVFELMYAGEVKWLDHTMDVVAPAVLAIIIF